MTLSKLQGPFSYYYQKSLLLSTFINLIFSKIPTHNFLFLNSTKHSITFSLRSISMHLKTISQQYFSKDLNEYLADSRCRCIIKLIFK